MDSLVICFSPKFVVASSREGPVFEGMERKVRLAAFTVYLKPRLSANGRVSFLRVYRFHLHTFQLFYIVQGQMGCNKFCYFYQNLQLHLLSLKKFLMLYYRHP